MVKTNSKKILAVIIALIMALSVVQLVAFADDKTTALVTFSYYDGEFVIAPVLLSVEEGLAKDYGFDVPAADHTGAAVNGVTAFDVLVAAHKSKYGDAFTPETAKDYIGYSGFVTKIFGESKYPSFTINGKTPHDDVYNEEYSGYTGYGIDTAIVKSGDRMQLYVNRNSSYLDYNTSFDFTDLVSKAGGEITVYVDGICLTYYGCAKQEVVDEKTVPMEGVTVSLTKDFETYTEVGTVDENGYVTFSVAEPGSYYLVTGGEYEPMEIPVIGTYANLTISAPETLKATFMADGKEVKVVEFLPGAESIEEPEVPAKEGYEGKWAAYTLGESDLTINAEYSAIEYIAKFVADGNTVAEVPYTMDDKNITAPEVPAKEGFTGEWEEYKLTAGGITVNAVYTENAPADLCPLDGKDHGDNFFGKIVRFLHNIIFRIISLFKLPA